MFSALTVGTYRLEWFCVLYDRIELVRDRDISVGVFGFRPPYVKKMFFLIDIPADQVHRFVRSTSAFEHNDKKKIRRILFIT